MPERPKTSQEGHDHDVCPNCGAELCGGRIYEDWSLIHAGHRGVDERGVPTEQARREYAESYGWPRRLCGSKVIGIEIPDHFDGVAIWHYPCCGAEYDRFTGIRLEPPPDFDPEVDGDA